MTGRVIGWKLDRVEREVLLKQFPPRYQVPIADHVTLGSDASARPVPPEVRAEIVGRTDDEDSLEALVVSIDGTVDRPDGSTYHISWSLGPHRKPRESNDVLRQCGWKTLDQPVPLRLIPARF